MAEIGEIKTYIKPSGRLGYRIYVACSVCGKMRWTTPCHRYKGKYVGRPSPMCNSCHSKVNTRRAYWSAYFTGILSGVTSCKWESKEQITRVLKDKDATQKVILEFDEVVG